MFPNPHPRFPVSGLLATGQTTQYGGFLDDGALRKGIAKSYSVLTTGQYSGTTNITINSKTDVHSNNCVVDNNTGLMWSRYLSASVGTASNGLLAWTTTGSGATAQGIFPYCAAANAAGLASYSDWRVPNLFELFYLCDLEAVNSFPDSTAFPTWSGSSVYTSTTGPSVTTGAMFINFTTGAVSRQDKTLTGLVILVRG